MRDEKGKESLMVCLSEYQIEIEKTIRDVIDIYIFMYFLINLTQSILRINPGQGQNYQLFGGLLVSVKSIEKVTSTQEQVQKYCNWRKEALFCL